MSARLQVIICENHRPIKTAEFDGRVELGRQRETNEEPFSYRIEGDHARFVIARREETTVGRSQLWLEPRGEGRVKVTNGSDRQPVHFHDHQPLPPGQSLEYPLPLLIVLSQARTIRVQRVGTSHLHSLDGTTMPPRATPGSGSRFPGLSLGSGRLENREVITWLNTAIDVLHAAADSADFFDRAARAVVEIVDLDSARVLLFERNEWQPRAIQVARGTSSVNLRRPSTTVLDKVRQEVRTTWEEPGMDGPTSESLAGVDAVVAAPLLNRTGEVIGALYGERRRAPRTGHGAFSEVEAMLVELMARGVAAGLARLEQEREAIAARVQMEQFFTKDLAQYLITHPDMLQGRDREVTAFFSDIRGFSEISERMEAKHTIPWCREVLDLMSSCVLEHKGVLVDFVGDGLMAMWGAPGEQPDHAALACKAAQAIWNELPALSKKWEPILSKPTVVGIGINTGMAQVGNVGSQHKVKYGALGNTVNLASRVQGATKYFKSRILVTGATRERLDPSFVTRRLGRVKVMNIQQPIELHELFPSDMPNALEAKQVYESALTHFEQEQFGQCARTLGDWRAHHSEDDPVLVLLYRAVRAMVEGRAPSHPIWEMKEK